MESRIQDCLGFPYMERYVSEINLSGNNFFQVTSTLTIPYGSRGLTDKLLYFAIEKSFISRLCLELLFEYSLGFRHLI